MFGYVVANQALLTKEQVESYRGVYCGLCKKLGEQYGNLGRLTLTYDMTFLIMLLNALEEPALTGGTERCIVHPLRKHGYTQSAYTDYGADLNVLLAYYNAIDDWEDEKNRVKLRFAEALKPRIEGIEAKYPRQSAAVKQGLATLAQAEKRNAPLDESANAFASLMGELFVPDETGHFAPQLKILGESLGRFIYLLDAFLDVEKDVKSGAYNPLKDEVNTPGFNDTVRQNLTLYIAEGAEAFERLPIVANGEILRNILYSGVWTRYELKLAQEEKKRSGASQKAAEVGKTE